MHSFLLRKRLTFQSIDRLGKEWQLSETWWFNLRSPDDRFCWVTSLHCSSPVFLLSCRQSRWRNCSKGRRLSSCHLLGGVSSAYLQNGRESILADGEFEWKIILKWLCFALNNPLFPQPWTKNTEKKIKIKDENHKISWAYSWSSCISFSLQWFKSYSWCQSTGAFYLSINE